MRNIDKRLQDLERAAQPARRFAIYQESLEPGERGMFRRGAGWRGRDDLPPLLTRDQVAEDADGATCIMITYEDRAGTTNFDFGPDTTAVYLPHNHRGPDGQAG